MNTPVITQQHTDGRSYSQVTHQTPSRQTSGRPNKRPRAGSSSTDNSASFKSTYQEHPDSGNIPQNTNENDEKIKKWNWDLVNDFKNNISQERKDMIFESLNQISSDNIDQLKVDTIFEDVCYIMIDSARNTFGIFKLKKRKKVKPVDKPWFDEECRFARQNYRKLKRNISTKSSVQQKQNLRLTVKTYKKILNKKI
ncbi:unnamed protein product [Mytilus coruscus]|uniref:Uncharacterized protein n=1 Tax=Mytilus coruscus TaxID=42192 RepID=A0A6J7ZYH2_MYTCO|nr:unnamed protein product [Mytilus coruscus]